ncbi:MAG TPA: nucleoside-diphosphate kinase [Candidatus Saccharimonadales bacterium]
MEKTLVILKPDAIQRGLIGEIIGRFEKVGLKIVGAKMLVASDALLGKHYPIERREFIEGMGQKSLDNYKELDIDPVEALGTDDPYEIGKQILQWMLDYLQSGPVLAMVIEGPHAIALVRKLRGHTLPTMAAPGTITGDLSFDSSSLANGAKRPIKNLVHASGNKEEAEFEVNLWFTKDELFEYDTIHQAHMK